MNASVCPFGDQEHFVHRDCALRDAIRESGAVHQFHHQRNRAV